MDSGKDNSRSFGELPTFGRVEPEPETSEQGVPSWYTPELAEAATLKSERTEGIVDDGRTDAARRWTPGEVILGRYMVERELGQGGMGVVYGCLDRVGGVRVAVKCLPPELAHDSMEMEEVRENFRLVYGLSHPNIAGVRQLERDARGEYFLVMEVAEGESLRKWERGKWKAGGVGLSEAVAVLRQVAAALDYAHSEKVVHRDVKPGNVMIDGKGRIKVLDFGLADQIRTSLSRASQTYRGTSGTGPYMSPEQWRGRPQDGKTDQYALGVMAYEMLAGRLPFENTDMSVLREVVLKEEPDAIPGVPDGAMDAIRRAMAKDRGERFASCGEFVEALEGKRSAGTKTVDQPQSGPVQKPISVGAGGEKVFLQKVRLAKALEAAGREEMKKAEKETLERVREVLVAGEEALKAGQFGAAGALFGQTEGELSEWQSGLTARREAEARAEAEKQRLEEARRQEEERKARERAEAVARRKAGETKRIVLPGGVAMEMVWCPPGNFLMGSPADESGRHQHWVTLTEGFWMAKYAVTQKQWKSVMENNPSHFMGDNLPVECVSWNDCQEFCQKAGNGLRLPTEAEWEYACRAGSAGAYGGTGRVKEMGWYDALSSGQTHPVGEKRPNAWGLYDMHGNVWEWCADWYDSGYYAKSPGVDPKGSASGKSRVLRGGCYWDDPRRCRSASRNCFNPSSRGRNFGFRPVARLD